MLFNGKSIKIISGVSSSATFFCSAAIDANICSARHVKGFIGDTSYYSDGYGSCYEEESECEEDDGEESDVEKSKLNNGVKNSEKMSYIENYSDTDSSKLNEDSKSLKNIISNEQDKSGVKTETTVFAKDSSKLPLEIKNLVLKKKVNDVERGKIDSKEKEIDLLKLEIDLEKSKFSKGVKDFENYKKIKILGGCYKDLDRLAEGMIDFFKKRKDQEKRIYEKKVLELEKKLEDYFQNVKNVDKTACENDISELENVVELLERINSDLKIKFYVAKSIFFSKNYLSKGYLYYLEPENQHRGEEVANEETKCFINRALDCYRRANVRSDMKKFFKANKNIKDSEYVFENEALESDDFIAYLELKNKVKNRFGEDKDLVFDFRGGGIDDYIGIKKSKIRELKERIDEGYLKGELETPKRLLETIVENVKSYRKDILKILEKIESVSIEGFDIYKQKLIDILENFSKKSDNDFVDNFCEYSSEVEKVSWIGRFSKEIYEIFKKFYKSEYSKDLTYEMVSKGADFLLNKMSKELEECKLNIQTLQEKLKSLNYPQNLDVQEVLSYTF